MCSMMLHYSVTQFQRIGCKSLCGYGWQIWLGHSTAQMRFYIKTPMTDSCLFSLFCFDEQTCWRVSRTSGSPKLRPLLTFKVDYVFFFFFKWLFLLSLNFPPNRRRGDKSGGDLWPQSVDLFFVFFWFRCRCHKAELTEWNWRVGQSRCGMFGWTQSNLFQISNLHIVWRIDFFIDVVFVHTHTQIPGLPPLSAVPFIIPGSAVVAFKSYLNIVQIKREKLEIKE